ncbi:MAG: hypothetical protein K2K85_04245 [Clostridia bacterium]|nr:hypothetical protein [Clostridia bacterium]
MEDVAKNNDTLGELYALRAGLSLISQNADELCQTEENELDEILKNIEEKEEIADAINLYSNNIDYYCANGRYNDIEVMQWVVDQKCEDVAEDEECEEDESDCFSYRELNKIKEQNGCNDLKDEKNIHKAKKSFVQWLCSKEFELQFERYKSHIEDKKKRYKEFAQRDKRNKILRSLIDITLIIGIIVSICFLVINIKSEKFGFAFLCGLGIVAAGILIWLAHGFIDTDRGIFDCERYNLNVLNEFKEINKAVHKHYVPQCEKINNSSAAVYESLQKTFNKLLDERDWQYLDLIIFYIETGRAESIKEALQLLEREIQTKRIIGAIQEATECICSTIESAAARISAQLGVISNQLSQIASQQQVQIAQNAEIISQAKLQNALIAKSNVTSEQLMNDVEFIKTYGVEIRK